MSNQRILLVDDEEALLNALRRRLTTKYDVSTATSGRHAISVLSESPPFPVVVTDMRMPIMNGVEFIANARPLAPDTVFVMLTGNQDQATAVAALNEGHVFRFLNKPCDIDSLMRTIEAAIRHYELTTAEKVLLHKTFVGAVSVMTDVLELVQPEVFSQAPRIESLIDAMRAACGASDRWEFRMSARLGLMGFAMLPPADRLTLQSAPPSDPKSQRVFAQATATSARLIERIPRLETLGQIMRLAPNLTGACKVSPSPANDEVATLGAMFFRAAVHWTNLKLAGVSQKCACEELKQVLPNLPLVLFDALMKTCQDLPVPEPMEVQLHELREGMVLYEDIVTVDDVRLLRKGQRLSTATLEKLCCHYREHLASRVIRVCATSRQEESALACSV